MNKTTAKTGRPLLLLFFIFLLAASFFVSLSPVYAETTTTVVTSGENPKITTTTAITVEGNITTTKVTTKKEETTYDKRKFSTLSPGEKTAVLQNLIKQGLVKEYITVEGAGKQYLSTSVWQNEGIISYGQTHLVNAAVSATSHSNYDEETGQYRYWGYDINGGLYTNNDFPPDSDMKKAPYKKNWLTLEGIYNNTIARGYVGEYTMNLGFPYADREATAKLFLTQNPAWGSYGITAPYILNHFYFNSVVSDTGFTQGQFIGVHRSTYNNKLYYQDFVLKQDQILWPVPTVNTTETTTTTITDSAGTPITTDSGIVVVDPDPTISAVAALSLPKTTYVGHLALARDCSMYDVDGVSYSAARAYEEGLADNDFDAPDGTLRRVNKLQSTVSYDEVGQYNVTLQAIPDGGLTAEDTQSIDVLPTPDILATLTGTQKENRKQVLNLKVATSPKDPLASLSVKLERLDGAGNPIETVTLLHKLGAGANTLSNSDTIKTRPMEALTSDLYFTNCKLEFLTKNKASETYRYTVQAESKGGIKDTETETFTVSPDLPPAAAIDMSNYFVREKNSNTAKITPMDATTTDGDQVDRTWSYRPITSGAAIAAPFTEVTPGYPGYEDQSFGSGKAIGFDKSGVGLFEVQLLAKDVWTEETLPEYITEADYLTGSAIVTGEVLNVAPVVSLSPVNPKTAEITILTGGEGETALVKAKEGQIQQTLLQNGVDAHITIEQMLPKAAPNVGNSMPAVMKDIETPLGYQGNWSAYESANFIVDENCFYKLDATWPGTSLGEYPQAPYTITCWDTTTKSEKWKYTFNDSLFGANSILSSSNGGATGSLLAQDEGGRYVFLRIPGAGATSAQTLVLSKDNGSYLTLLPFDIGSGMVSTKETIYSIRTDGLYATSSKTGQSKKVYAGKILPAYANGGNPSSNSPGRVLEGRLQFVTARNGLLCRALFDLETQAMQFEVLGNPVTGTAYSPDLCLVALDSGGKIITSQSEYTDSTTMSTNIVTYGRNNRCMGTVSLSSTYAPTLMPVMNAKGECNYIANTSSGRNSYCLLELRGLTNGYYASAGNSPTASYRPLFAREIAEKVYVYTGADWVYVWQQGYQIYPERVRPYLFDLSTPNTGQGTGVTIPTGIDLATYEYGVSSDSLIALQAGYNSPGGGYSKNLILTWEQSLPMILERYVKKCSTKAGDFNAVLIFDETNSALYTEGTLSDLKTKLASPNTRLLRTDREELEANTLGTRLLSLGEEKNNMLGVSVEAVAGGTAGTGKMERTLQLSPNTTYYYEYEVKPADSPSGGAINMGDLLTLSHDTGGSTPFAQYGAAKYVVEGSLCEDFNDETLAQGFAAVTAGYPTKIENGCLMATSAKVKRGTGYGATNLTFTIPEGLWGVVSFDWLTNAYNKSTDTRICWRIARVSIDGQAWEQWLEVPGSGHYGHPRVLGAGTHTLTVESMNEGYPILRKMCIDNLTIDLVRPQTGSGEQSQGTQVSLGTEEAGGGFSHVTGNFTTPFATGTYDWASNLEVMQGLSNPPYMEYLPGDRYTPPKVNFTLPGRKEMARGVFYGTAVLTRPDNSHCAGFLWGNQEYAWYYTSTTSGWNALPPSFSGTKTLAASSSNKYGHAVFHNALLLFAPAGQGAAGRGNGFYGGHEGATVYFASNNLYKSTKMTLTLPEGNSLLRNWKLYYVDSEGKKVYLEDEDFAGSASLASWTLSNAKAAIVQEAVPKKDETSLVYKRGELVGLKASYFDYESDPSKKQYWRYTHTPMNDGANPDAAVILDEDGNVVSLTGKILNAPIQRFYIDGKYTVEHWQEDDTTRGSVPGGNPAYDKISNSVFMTFYVEGGGMAPWIESIGTTPAKVKEGDAFQIGVRVNDADKDELRLTTEVYYKKELIYREKKTGITAVNGIYPAVTTATLPDPAETGSYEVICTVRDWTGAGIGSYRFTVVSEGKITGNVYHTDEWTRNRRTFNQYYFKENFDQNVLLADYQKESLPRKRGSNVFWSGEKFLLSAMVGGDAQKVTVSIEEVPGHSAGLQKSTASGGAVGETLWTGSLWDESMKEELASKKPRELTFRFTAYYAGGTTKTHEVKVIVDDSVAYWLLHRTW